MTQVQDPSRKITGEQFKKLARALFAYLKPYKRRLLQAAGSMVVLALIKNLIIYVSGPVIKGVFMDKNEHLLMLVVT
ncbi:MAG: hypothetical protein M0011_06175, partial [Elusimicrobia bacterium]|nr:hypothetical protein [Elusimicrobiota bacterium]